jgi:hypothetical protein
MVQEGLIMSEEALRRLAEVDLTTITRSRFAEPLPEPLAHASRMPGTMTSDIAGMAEVTGILTAVGARARRHCRLARDRDAHRKPMACVIPPAGGAQASRLIWIMADTTEVQR